MRYVPGRTGEGDPCTDAPEGRRDASRGAGPVVLLVEDDPDLREVLGVLLREQGWRVLEAGSGDQALALALAEPLDALVTDQRLPGLSGVGLLARLREAGVEVPTVIVSASSEVRAAAEGLGVRAFLSKPFEVDELLAALERVLREG